MPTPGSKRRRKRSSKSAACRRAALIPGSRSWIALSNGRRTRDVDLSANADILFERRGTAGIVILNRPQALNAVTHAMMRALAEQLAAWSVDHAVTRVL